MTYSDKRTAISEAYGLTQLELYVLFHLNDDFGLNFKEFSDIFRHAPKTYNTITNQRLEDSLQWLKYIRTLRPDNTIPLGRTWHTWGEFFDYQCKIITRKILSNYWKVGRTE